MIGRALTDYETQILANVHEHGCQVVSVFDPTEETPSFSYSVGFWESFGQPEVIILGLSSEMGHFAVNEACRQCGAGLTLFDGQRIDGLFEEFDVTCVARKVDARYLVVDYFNSALWYHFFRTGRALSTAVQLVWTYNGYLPWDIGAPAELLEDQPLLFSGVLH